MSNAPAVIGSLEPWSSGEVLDGVTCVLAPNPSPMTLDGTNTWIVASAGSAVIIDPGPADSAHLDATREVLERAGLVPRAILLTHGHDDHSEGAGLFAERLGGIGVRALDPRHRLGSEGLHDGEAVEVGGIALEVVATPGHSSDSLSFVLGAHRAVLTGDTVLGRGTTVVAWPDGSLREYLSSLHRLQDLARERDLARVLPGHGPAVADPGSLLADYLAHRDERLDQVRQAVAGGARSVQEVVEAVYQPLPSGVYPAALASAAAQWQYLVDRGEIPPPAP